MTTSPSSSSSTITSLLSTSNPSDINIINFVSVKLEKIKYLLLNIIQTHDLVGYVDGSFKCPPPFLPYGDGSSANPEYTKWIKLDQHLASWIMAALTEPILAQVDGPI